ncbi:putative polyketide synthase [Lentinula aciculospora]|uniref:Polyketide synthase n=1 Tax=Lentinula aciculospora TaxID=153920 RepID=A0A9W9DJ91_9AGAR|nr:putative polyketide synthase [Lentinula aciculospora]
MTSLSQPQLFVPIFAGQGSTPSTLSSYIDSTVQRCQHGLCATLLTICHEAFIDELSSLSALELAQAGVDPNEFRSPRTLLTMWLSRLPHNAVMSSSALVLMQLLQYLSFVEQLGAETGSLRPFADLLTGHSTSSVGILGFSSGILSACAVASSDSAKSYLSFALEAYRLALWIGIRCQIYRSGTSNSDTTLPWSVVFLGISSEVAQEAILNFRSERGVTVKSEDPSQLYITAIMDSYCVTVSGCPPVLAEFTSNVRRTLPSVIAHQTTVDTLYHSPVHLSKVREQILSDIVDRSILFPEFSHLRAPVRSTSTGTLLGPSVLLDRSLVQLVIDMLIIEPVRWDLVISQVSQLLPAAEVLLLNFGPGLGVARTLEKSCPQGRVRLRDICPDVHDWYRPRSRQEPIAIVGMAVNMPGSPNPTKLWEVLEKGLNTVVEIPENRFNIQNYDGIKNPNRRMKARTGNFIQGVDEFDNRFFKISPREAKSMDPQQRILLHMAYEALEDSGYVPGMTPSSQPDAFGCYIGAATHDYVQNLRGDIDVYYSTGTLCSYLSGRISYAMGWSGPSMVVDTACSSSLAAVYQGARALMNGDCKSALVGGVNIITSPDMFLGLDRGHFLSPTGQCKAFDASADGYSRGEGCGLFVLKRLSDALAENDNIYGVIRGIEVNQSGLAHSITHPHAPTQIALFERALHNAAINPSRVNVVEAHGTGTQAGDVNELASIRQVFATGRSPQNPLHVTSVKGNIGHLEAASGAAGLAKLLLMLKHRTIPPQTSFKKLNPSIDPLENDNTVILHKKAVWDPSHYGSRRVAFLNNFGAAGSNVALVLEEHMSSPSQVFDHPLVFILSAKDEHALEKLRVKYIQWLRSEESEAVSLVDIAYSMTTRRQLYSYRLTVVALERAQLAESLRKAAIIGPSAQPTRKVVFVFSGQSSQYLGMGQVLYNTSPLFKRNVDECHAILVSMGFPGVLPIIMGNEDVLSESEKLEAYQAAIFSLEYALGQLWIFWGLFPAALIGHSLGEYTALVFAGVLSLRGALTLVAHRVCLMLRKCELNSTGMLAINLSPVLVKHLLGYNFHLAISCYNGPNDCVVSGPLEVLKEFKAFLDDTKSCRSKMLAVPYGYHSDIMNSISAELTSIAEDIEIRTPNLPIASNVDGSVVLPGTEGFFKPGYFAKHCSLPVQFDDGVRTLVGTCGLSGDVWLEIGPHPTCLPMLKTHSSLSSNAILVSSLKRHQDSWLTLGSTVCSLIAVDVPLHCRNIFAHLPHARCTSLPSYPFAPSKYWVPYKEDCLLESRPRQSNLTSEYTLLHRWEQYPCLDNGSVAIFETPISHLSDLILGHKVGGLPLCPASVFIEIVLSAVELSIRYRDASANENFVQISSSHFVKGLVYKENVPRTVVTKIYLEDGRGSFSISSRVDPSSELILHVRGDYLLQPISDCAAELCQLLPSVTGSMYRLKDSSTRAEIFLSRTTYDVVFPRVVHYSKEYHTMQSLLVSPTDLQGCASVRLPSSLYQGMFTAHPVFLDTLLQVPGFVANLQGTRQCPDQSNADVEINAGDVFICSEIASFSVFTTSLDDNATYSVYCRGVWSDHRTLSFDVFAVKDGDSQEVIALLKGVVFRQMALETLRRALSMAAISGQIQASQPLPVLINPPLQSRARSHSSPPNFVNVAGELRSRVFEAIADTCGVSPEQITANTALDALGIDSLMLIELSAKLQFLSSKIDLQLQSLYSCKTVADIIQRSSSVLGLGNIPALTVISPSTTCAESEPPSPSTLAADDGLDTVKFRADGYFDVKSIISTALNTTEAFEDNTDLEYLGLDSLASIEVLHTLQVHFGRQLPSDFLRKYRTVAAVHEHFSLLQSDLQHYQPFVLRSPPQGAAQARLVGALRLGTNPVRVQAFHGNSTPIFFIHDGSGLVNYYDKVRPLHRNVWAIYNPQFLPSLPWGSVKHMAVAYADYICALSTGTILLGGWSFGGVVAYEVALQLAKRGINTKGIILIDAPNPIGHVPLPEALIKTVARYDHKTGPVEIGKLVQTQFAMNAQLLSAYDPHETEGACPPLVFLRSESGYAVKGMDVPSWLADRSDPTKTVAGWTELSSSVEVWDIPGHHFQAFDNVNIASVSAKLSQACEYLETL